MIRWFIRLITCPENHRTAAVTVNPFRLTMRLHDCSRWPEKKDCGQECLQQVAESPEACLLRNIVTEWYAGKSCAVCAKPIGEIAWHERPPALLAGDGRTRTWKEAKPEDLPELFASHEPCCWPCHIRESFRAEHADLIVERRRVEAPHATLPPSVAVY